MKVNVGCYTVMFKGWLNVDILPMEAYAIQNGYQFMRYDIAWGLPFNHDSVDYIFSSHSLEHITYREGLNFLNHAFHSLKPGGVMRVGVPDAGLLCRRFLDRNFTEIDSNNADTKATPHFVQKFWNVLTSGHKAAYDKEYLKWAAEEVGFVYEPSSYQRGSEVFIRECQDMFPEVSLYAELKKP